MSLLDLVAIADKVYDPDGVLISEYFTPEGTLVEPPPTGDTLALFVARELADTFDPDADDYEQRQTAAQTFDVAVRQIGAVAMALDPS